MVEDAFRISQSGARRTVTDSRNRRLTEPNGALHRAARHRRDPRGRVARFLESQSHSAARAVLGTDAAVRVRVPGSQNRFRKVFQVASYAVNALLEYAEEGSKFLFGPLGEKSGPYGVIFAFQVLPIVIFIASIFAVLYQLGVMQVVVRAMAVVMQRVMRASGAESTSVAASIFMGQTEAPLTIRPFLAGLTQSELFTIMTSGMAHVSGAVMAAYVKIAQVDIKHLLTAVIMTAPATIMLAKIMMPGNRSSRPRRAMSKWRSRSRASTSSMPPRGARATDCNSR